MNLKNLVLTDQYLDSLEANNCKSLTKLAVSNLSHINISNCDSLRSLRIRNCHLKFLDVNNCKILDTLDCSHNQLKYLDVSHCDSLRSLNVSNNQLELLDVSNSKNLNTLDCSHNQLKYVDINRCDNLYSLNAAYNQIPLSTCHALSYKLINTILNNKGYFRLTPQNITLKLKINETLNLNNELYFDGYKTTFVTNTPKEDYIFKDSSIYFLRSGHFSFTLKNESVRHLDNWNDGVPHWFNINVQYHITVPERITQPVFLPKQSSLLEDETITISCSADSAKIYYTLDGSKPNPTSFLYTEPFSLQPNTTTTIKAIATKEGFSDSQIAMATYTVKPKQNEPDNDTVSNLSHTHRFTLQLYPNPCHDVIYMTTDEPNATMDIHMLRILDLQGHERKRIMGNIHAIDISQLPAGIYVLESAYKNGHIDHHKIIKQ